MTDKLGHPDSFYLEAAQGWLELGDWRSAHEELDCITPELRTHPSVLLLRGQVFFAGEKWDGVLAISETLGKLAPNQPQGWVHRSYALHELERTQEAFDLLLPVASVFPDEWVIPYNLACYTARLGRIPEAESWFKQAMAIDEMTVKRIGIDDPDLEPLWKGMVDTTWRRLD